MKLTPAKVTVIMFMVVGGLVVAYVAKSLLAHEEKKPEVAFRNVPMPISDLLPGTKISEEHVGLGPIAVSELKRDMLLNNKVIVGRVVREKLKAAQPIRTGSLYEPGERPPLKLSRGMRAVSLDVQGASGIVNGLIKPGEYVDLHFAVTALQGDPRLRGGMSMTLLKGVKVLAINSMTTQGKIETDRNSVTLELTVDQANVIMVARDRGTITLTFNPNGKGNGRIALASKDRATLEEILGLEPIKVPAPPPSPPPPFISRIYRGSVRQQHAFRDNEIFDLNGGGAMPTPPSVSNPPAPAAPVPAAPVPAAPVPGTQSSPPPSAGTNGGAALPTPQSNPGNGPPAAGPPSA